MQIFKRALVPTLLMPFLAAGMLTAIAAVFALPASSPWLMPFYFSTVRYLITSPSAWMGMALLGLIAAKVGKVARPARSR